MQKILHIQINLNVLFNKKIKMRKLLFVLMAAFAVMSCGHSTKSDSIANDSTHVDSVTVDSVDSAAI